jgi:hypothetical protein
MNSAIDDIFYVHADSIFDGELITLLAGQRLLGEGADTQYFFLAIDGNLVEIPKATAGTDLPIIRNSPAGLATITLATNSEVGGFSIENSGEIGIFGDGLKDADGNIILVGNTSIDGALRGIDIRNSDGTFIIEDVSVSNTTDDGILLTDNGDALSTITFMGTTSVDNPGGVGISVRGGEADVTFNEVLVTNRNSTGIGIGRNVGDIVFNEPISIDNPSGAVEEAIGVADSLGDVTFDAVTITDNSGVNGNPAVLLGDLANSVTFESLNITTNNRAGLQGLVLGDLNINGGVISTINGRGVEINGIESADVTFTSVSSTNADRGIIFATGDASFTGSFTITGDGESVGSGGTITGAGIGLVTINVENVTVNYLDISSTEHGVLSINTDRLVVNASTIDGAANADWFGIRVILNSDDKSGSPAILTGNTITGSGIDQIGISYENTEAPTPATFRVDDHGITLTGTGTIGVNINAIVDDALETNGPGASTLLSIQDNNVVAETIFNRVDNGPITADIFGQLLINGVGMP